MVAQHTLFAKERIDFEDVVARARAYDLGNTVDSMRRGFGRLYLGEDAEPDPRPLVQVGGVEARLSGADNLLEYAGKRVWVWLHGGGYVFGSPETHRRVADLFAELTECAVVVPRYRLAPEHLWPAQREDAVSVVRDLQSMGFEVGLAGDSAGGHLALNTAFHLAQQGSPAVRLALFSPNTDRSGLNQTRQARAAIDPIVNDEFDTRLAKMCFKNWLPESPEVSPVLGPLACLPMTHIEVGGREILRDDSELLLRRAIAEQVGITLHETKDAVHMWQLWSPWLPAAKISLARAAEVLR